MSSVWSQLNEFGIPNKMPAAEKLPAQMATAAVSIDGNSREELVAAQAISAQAAQAATWQFVLR